MDGSEGGVGLHQSRFLFGVMVDKLTDEVRQDSLWIMMFADDVVIYSESREQVEESLERRGTEVGGSKIEKR